MMTEKERQELLEMMEKYKKLLDGNKEASREFLVDLGIYTEKGNLRQNYKHLCIPLDQA